MANLPHVTWLRAFEAAARHRSFSRAAEELSLTPAAISQQVKLLEQHLGSPLFNRLPRGVELTDIGHAYAQPVRKSFADLRDATTGLFSDGQRGVVRVRASISYAALVLAPALGTFTRDHPDIDVQLSTAVWTDRFDDDAIDVEIRFGHGDWDEPDIRHLGHRSATLVCHPDFAASFDGAPRFHDLAAHAVQIVGSETDWFQMSERHGLAQPPRLGLTKVDSSLMALQIVASGTGSAIVSEDFTRNYLADGLLVEPFSERLPLSRSFYLVVHRDAHKRRDVRQFCDWLLG